ncbi:MAG: hypothetical protein SFU25_01000 [Candidatus Caenarcaniphilales bacterium]|nr:hypothetical protein [Candidatus Caenarcaniphilales bacterium]
MEILIIEPQENCISKDQELKQAYEYSIAFITKLMHQQNLMESKDKEELVKNDENLAAFQLEVEKLATIQN